MKLVTAINQFIDYRTALGDCFENNKNRLEAFSRSIGLKANLSDVKLEAVDKFLVGNNPTITAYWHVKYHILNGFYRYAISRGYINTSPLPKVIPKKPPTFVPYIYSTEELHALFEACLTYQENWGHQLDPKMLHALFLLLYGTGLRVGEAVNLTLADIDLDQALLTIRETKFFKTRFVPIGKQLTKVLQEYAEQRHQRRCPQNPESPFFIGRNGKRIKRSTLVLAFHMIRKKASIRRTDAGRFQPRIHDLRHTFAVHRLTSWYKEGADVQRLLGVLSVYMGHVSPVSTSIYLTMTPELLKEAGHRFEQYAFKEDII